MAAENVRTVDVVDVVDVVDAAVARGSTLVAIPVPARRARPLQPAWALRIAD